MREIKFRAWYEKEKQFVHFSGIFNVRPIVSESQHYSGTTLVTTRSYGASIIEQFTGLHDKNGKEIYEGDIVTCTDTYNPCHKPFTGVVGFNRGSFMIDCDGSTHYRWADYFVKVIGNIHESEVHD